MGLWPCLATQMGHMENVLRQLQVRGAVAMLSHSGGHMENVLRQLQVWGAGGTGRGTAKM